MALIKYFLCNGKIIVITEGIFQEAIQRICFHCENVIRGIQIKAKEESYNNDILFIIRYYLLFLIITRQTLCIIIYVPLCVLYIIYVLPSTLICMIETPFDMQPGTEITPRSIYRSASTWPWSDGHSYGRGQRSVKGIFPPRSTLSRTTYSKTGSAFALMTRRFLTIKLNSLLRVHRAPLSTSYTMRWSIPTLNRTSNANNRNVAALSGARRFAQIANILFST